MIRIFRLTEALANLKAAQEAKTAFLKEAKLENDEAVKAEVTVAEKALSNTGEVVDSDNDGVADAPIEITPTKLNATTKATEVDSSKTVMTGVWLTTDTVGVKAAKLADAEAELANNVANYTASLEKQKGEIAKAGLTSPVNVYNARVDATEKATEAAKLTSAAVDGAEATLGGVLTGGAVVSSYTKLEDVTVKNSAGTVTYIAYDADKKALVLTEDVPAAYKAQATALLNAISEDLVAQAAKTSATEAENAAFLAIGYLDYKASTVVGGSTLGALKEEVYKAAKGISDPLTAEQTAAAKGFTFKQAHDQLNSFLQVLKSFDPALTVDSTTGAITNSADFVPPTNNDKYDAASAGYPALLSAIDAFEDEFDASDLTNLVTLPSLISAQNDLKAANEQVELLKDLVAELNEAKELVSTMEALNADIATALKFFEDNGYAEPQLVDIVAMGTDEADIFLVNGDSNIIGFGEKGADAIFFGEKFSLVTLSATDKLVTGDFGDLAAFEVFAQQSGADTILYIEQKSFAGNASTDADLITVKLTGVQADSLVIENGALVIA